MRKQYSKEELWTLFEKLPQELKEAVFSQETADYIFNACDRNEVNEVSKVAYYVGLVLMGALLPSDFQKTLQEELSLEETVAKSVATEINRFVFYPVKPALEQLHAIAGGQTPTEKTPANTLSQKKPAAEPVGTSATPEKNETGPRKEDAYREPVE